ncbi:MAG: SMC family ATPase [Candidatus Diapherotrites archaeon]|nr:SMC family ATPase [Candidatus Diapherotrites archaeon]
MINKIYLENWKCHCKTELTFSKGTNVIIGVMGAGKTSIMDAICFCLYGTFPALSSKKVTLDDLITSKPNKADYAILKLDFDYNERSYCVERKIKRKGASEANLYESGKLIFGPKPKDVNAKIEEILGVSYELFVLAVYSEQNELDYFLKLSASERKRKFDQLLQLDKYELARSNAVSLLNYLKKLLEERERVLKELKKSFSEEELVAAREKLKQIQINIEHNEKKLKELDKEISVQLESLKKEEEKLERQTYLERNKALCIERISSINKRVLEYKEEISKKSFLDLNEINRKIDLINQKINELESKEQSIKKNISEISSSLGEISSNKKRAIKMIYDLKNLGNKCPVCSQPVKEELKQTLVEENNKLINMLEKEESDSKNKIIRLEKESDEIRRAIKEKNKELEILLKSKSEAEMVREKEKKIISLESEIVAEKNKLENIEKELSSINIDKSLIESKRELVSSLRETKASIKKELESYFYISKEVEKNIILFEKKKSEIENYENFIKKASTKMEKLKIFINALVSMQVELRDYLLGAINEAMDNIWDKVYPYKDYTSAKILIEESSYEVVVCTRDGSWVSVDGILSGGERSSVALVMRISVSLVLARNLGWIILDEPTHNLDSNAVFRLADMLRNHLPELVEQIFIITHDKNLENAASGSLYILDRDKARDEPTKIISY